MVESSDKMWSTKEGTRLKRLSSSREGNGKPLQYSCLENPMDSMKRNFGEVTICLVIVLCWCVSFKDDEALSTLLTCSEM